MVIITCVAIISFFGISFLHLRESKEITRELLSYNRQLALLVKSENATEGQIVIERDMQASKPLQAIEASQDHKPEPLKKTFSVGGKQFTVFGLNPEIEEEFLKEIKDGNSL